MRPFVLAVSCLALAACSSGNVAPTAPSAAGALETRTAGHEFHVAHFDGKKSAGVIYAADPGDQTVWIVPQTGKNQKASGSITGFSSPQGLAVDASQNLYVADATAAGGGVIDVFAPGASAPTSTLTGVPSPYSIGVDSKGNVYSNCESNDDCTLNAVSVFSAGSTTPTSTLTDSNLTAINYIAVDAAGDVFVDGDEPGFPVRAYEIDEFPAGQTTPTIVDGSINAPSALFVDKQGNLIVGQANGADIQVFAPPYSGSPTSSYETNCQSASLTLNAAGTALWYDCAGQAYQVKYPKFKAVESSKSLSRWGLAGLAASPGSI